MGAAICSILGLNFSVKAQSLSADLITLLDTHPRIVSARHLVEVSQQALAAAYSGYYPTIAAQTSAGHETLREPDGNDDTSMGGRDATLSVSQRVYDFGATQSAIDLERLRTKRATIFAQRVEQEVLQEGISAYIGVISAVRQIDFAQQSVENVKRQANVEDLRVSRGAGYQTDVLQAKSQLAGAQARLVASEGALEQAISDYQAVFNKKPDLEALPEALPTMNPMNLPISLEDGLETLLRDSPRLALARIDRDISQEETEGARANNLFPTFDLEGSQVWQNDRGGVEGSQIDSTISFRMSYQFDGGLTMFNRVREAEARDLATRRLYDDLLNVVNQEMQVAWSLYQTNLKNAELLKAQSELALGFLELAREEREAGKRSLIEVLSGETAYITALSDADLAVANILQAQLTIIGLVNGLNPSIMN